MIKTNTLLGFSRTMATTIGICLEAEGKTERGKRWGRRRCGRGRWGSNNPTIFEKTLTTIIKSGTSCLYHYGRLSRLLKLLCYVLKDYANVNGRRSQGRLRKTWQD